MIDHPHRRSEDTFLSKLIKFWPIILSLIVFLMAGATLKAKVESSEVRLAAHEERITRLEQDMSKVRDNTDLLVERLIRHK